ncbi:DUF6541 family protein [Schaalia sp. Marseille-Q2122]|uniref:DUF6541 family protein n=1 Tax=Schaalia sp. Marseille-Q2122 TaxID=2736604 RepID=UPI00158D3970|nr:DUF6541 family protein [Schaalia sp. Marseille-Q2122]
MLSEWIPLFPLLVLMMVAAILPGYFWLRASIRSSLVAAAAAPAFTFGVLTVASVVFARLSVPWAWWSVGVLLLVVTAGGMLFWRSRWYNNPESQELLGSAQAARPPFAGDSPAAHAYRILTPRARRQWWLLVAAGWLLAALPMLLVADPHNPAQQWDAVFHVTGVWHMTQSMEASPLSALAPLYGGQTGIYYPIAWHIFVTLFAAPTTVIEAANVSSLFLMAVWVMGAGALTAVVSTSRVAVMAAPLVAGTMLSMPADALTMYNQWPHATGVALLPGVVAVAIVWGRRLVRSTELGLTRALPHLPLGMSLVVSSVGLAHSHASSVFGAAWTLLIPTVAGAVSVVRRSVLCRDWAALGAAAVVAIAAVCGPLLVLMTEQLQGMGRYPRRGLGWDFAVSRALTPFPPFAQTMGLYLTLAIFLILTVLGALRLYQRTRIWVQVREDLLCPAPIVAAGQDSVEDVAGSPPAEGEAPEVPHGAEASPAAQPAASASSILVRPALEGPVSPEEWRREREWERDSLGPRPSLWLIGAFAVWAAATFLAYSPEDVLRVFLLSPWYMDPRRIMAVQNMVMVPLVSIGFAGMVMWVRQHRPQATRAEVESSSQWRIGVLLGAWLLALSLGGALDARFEATSYVYDPVNLGKPGMVTQGELDMIRRIPTTLPEDAVVLGDPIAGAAYVETIGQRLVFFPQLTTSEAPEPSRDLFRKHFNEIHTNPQVCEAVRREGITHFYADADGKYYNFDRSERHPGLYNVDTSVGFTVVDSGDDAVLYEITACR